MSTPRPAPWQPDQRPEPQLPCYEITFKGLQHLQQSGKLTNQEVGAACFGETGNPNYRDEAHP